MCLIFHARGSKLFFAGQSGCVEWSVKREEWRVKREAIELKNIKLKNLNTSTRIGSRNSWR